MNAEALRRVLIDHYDRLVGEGNDPARDPAPLRDYMDGWDGARFVEALGLRPNSRALEIGVGTGRLARRVCGRCKSFVGIDLSPRSIRRAKENLAEFGNVSLICADFLTHPFEADFDVIYSTLTFLHIEQKDTAVRRIARLLAPGGRTALSLAKGSERLMTYGGREIPLFPDSAESMRKRLLAAGLEPEGGFETEFAAIVCAQKGEQGSPAAGLEASAARRGRPTEKSVTEMSFWKHLNKPLAILIKTNPCWRRR